MRRNQESISLRNSYGSREGAYGFTTCYNSYLFSAARAAKRSNRRAAKRSNRRASVIIYFCGGRLLE